MSSASRTPERIVWAVRRLAPENGERILEIGCGPGHAVSSLCSRYPRCTVVAIDRSPLQTKKARAFNRDWIAAGRAQVETVDLEHAPSELGERFSKVLAINVNAFWTEPVVSCAHLRALLRPRGEALLVYESPSLRICHELGASLPRSLKENGFTVRQIPKPRAASSLLLGFVARRVG